MSNEIPTQLRTHAVDGSPLHVDMPASTSRSMTTRALELRAASCARQEAPSASA